VVKRDKDAQDEFALGLASMIHLFHTDPAYLRILKEITWAPITFGISIATEGSKAKYLIGTSLKAGSKFYLTVGYAFGTVHRLPGGITPDITFVQDANILRSLPTRNIARPFVGLSYSFIEVSPSRFGNMFVEPAPKALPPQALKIDPLEGPPETVVKVTVSRTSFTGDPEKDLFFINNNKVPPTEKPKAGDFAAKLTIPKGTKGPIPIRIEINGVTSEAQTFTVK
jgi:hypothetical protein